MEKSLTLNIATPIKFRLNFNLRIFLTVSFILIITLLIFYVFQVNEMTAASYLIRNDEKKIAEFSNENKNLQISLSQTNSLENLERMIQGLGYEKVEKVKYIQVLEGKVVRSNQ
jgi:hypothetical protein